MEQKKDYQKLLDKALRYEYLRQILDGDFFASPPTKDIKKLPKLFK